MLFIIIRHFLQFFLLFQKVQSIIYNIIFLVPQIELDLEYLEEYNSKPYFVRNILLLGVILLTSGKLAAAFLDLKTSKDMN